MGRARAPVWALAWAPDPAPGPIQAPAPGAPLGVDVPAALSAQAGGPQRVPVPADPLAADAPLEGAAVPAAVPLGAGVLLAEADAPAAVPSGAGAAADAGDPALRWLPARAQRSSGYPLWGQTKVCPLFFRVPAACSRRLRASACHAVPVRGARLHCDSGETRPRCAAAGLSPSLRSIRAAHDGSALRSLFYPKFDLTGKIFRLL